VELVDVAGRIVDVDTPADLDRLTLPIGRP
jgi:hypothetical protein